MPVRWLPPPIAIVESNELWTRRDALAPPRRRRSSARAADGTPAAVVGRRAPRAGAACGIETYIHIHGCPSRPTSEHTHLGRVLERWDDVACRLQAAAAGEGKRRRNQLRNDTQEDRSGSGQEAYLAHRTAQPRRRGQRDQEQQAGPHGGRSAETWTCGPCRRHRQAPCARRAAGGAFSSFSTTAGGSSLSGAKEQCTPTRSERPGGRGATAPAPTSLPSQSCAPPADLATREGAEPRLHGVRLSAACGEQETRGAE